MNDHDPQPINRADAVAQIEYSRISNALEAIEDNFDIESTELYNGTAHEFAMGYAFAGARNPDGTTQSLCAIIRAGNELFGLNRVEVLGTEPDSITEGYVLSVFGKAGERARVVGTVGSEAPLEVGRKIQTELAFSDMTSGNHFAVMQKNGKLLVMDRNSKNGTDVLTLDHIAEGSHLDFLTDLRSWAPKTAEAKAAVQDLGINEETIDKKQRKQDELGKLAVTARVDQSPEQRGKEKLKEFSSELGAIASVMDAVVGEMSHREEGKRFQLDWDKAHSILGASGFMYRSLQEFVRDTHGMGLLKDPEVQKTLREGFDLNVLPANTVPRHGFDWQDEQQVFEHAQLVREALDNQDRLDLFKHKELMWRIPQTLYRVSRTLDSLVKASRDNPWATSAFMGHYKWHEGNIGLAKRVSNDLHQQLIQE